MGSNEPNRDKKFSTQELFGDILGEVESVWEKRTKGSATGRGSATLADSTTKSPPAEAAAEVNAQPEAPTTQPRVTEPAQAWQAPLDETAALPDPPVTPVVEDEPTAELFTPPRPERDLPHNGHAAGASVSAPPPPQEAVVEPETMAPVETEPPVAASRAETQAATAVPAIEPQSSPSEPTAPVSAATPPAADRPTATPLNLPDLEQQPAEASTPVAAQPATIEQHTEAGSYLPWMEETGSTNWGRLGAMAAVAAVVGLVIWWFALRPAPAAGEVDAPAVVVDPANSFIAGFDEQLEGEEIAAQPAPAAARGAVQVQDQVTALVEDPTESGLLPEQEPTQPAVTPQAVQTGPTTAELEAMIATRLAAQERRLRAQLDEQRQALEDEIARIEAANSGPAAADTGETAAEDAGADVEPEGNAEAAAAVNQPEAEADAAAEPQPDEVAEEETAADESAVDQPVDETNDGSTIETTADSAGEQG